MRDLRKLSVVLFLFQCGISLYFQTILIFLNSRLHYTSLGLGLFWFVMGSGLILGLALLKSLMKRQISTSWLIFFSLIVQAIAILLSSIFSQQALLWGLVFLMAVVNPSSYSLLLTTFSDTAPQESQGWVMGIWGAVVAFAFVIAGLCNNLIPWIGLNSLIFLGGALIGLSGLLFHFIVKR